LHGSHPRREVVPRVCDALGQREDDPEAVARRFAVLLFLMALRRKQRAREAVLKEYLLGASQAHASVDVEAEHVLTHEVLCPAFAALEEARAPVRPGGELSQLGESTDGAALTSGPCLTGIDSHLERARCRLVHVAVGVPCYSRTVPRSIPGPLGVST